MQGYSFLENMAQKKISLHLKTKQIINEAILTLSNWNFNTQTFTTMTDWKETVIEKSHREGCFWIFTVHFKMIYLLSISRISQAHHGIWKSNSCESQPGK